ncbi:DUF4331 family protein [Ichthyenterobacterium sp. W332]|uniref:DUF4331 family protein n=1 Tax=Microcosmobacter mediterraneus TaxID=3075607 RepID=A0ABU2YLU9_9FLAO|nr:DUF4331 family protein [Ichthyenterobacterium sp. W332]MDT0559132.1 DUF4331 family protein [Ichthyenterobacterium sp. W332]
MKSNYIKTLLIFALAVFIVNCSSDDDAPMGPTGPNFSGTYAQSDQMGRPAVNTVFVSSASKDQFNTTIPSQQNGSFQAMFQANLEALSPAYANPSDANALGLDSAAFTGLLATDVLNVSLDGTTTFFDGTNVLTGRALSDDVITVELLLIFGGEDFSENPTLSNDNVDANDKTFLSSFPYLATPW